MFRETVFINGHTENETADGHRSYTCETRLT